MRRVVQAMVLAAATVGAQPAEPVETIRWSAPPGCPSAERVHAEVERRLGRPLRSDGSLTFRGDVVRDEAGLTLTLVVNRVGAVSERRVQGVRCESLTAAAALMIATVIDPEAVAVTAAQASAAAERIHPGDAEVPDSPDSTNTGESVPSSLDVAPRDGTAAAGPPASEGQRPSATTEALPNEEPPEDGGATRSPANVAGPPNEQPSEDGGARRSAIGERALDETNQADAEHDVTWESEAEPTRRGRSVSEGRSPRAQQEADEARRPRELGVVAAGFALLSAGELPRPTPGVQVSLGGRFGRVESWLGFAWLAPRVASLVDVDAAGEVGLAHGLARLCVAALSTRAHRARRFDLLPCASLEVGAIRGAGEGVDRVRTGRALWLAGAVGLQARLAIGRGLHLRALVDVEVPFVRAPGLPPKLDPPLMRVSARWGRCAAGLIPSSAECTHWA